ncbi:BatA domain-containing protein [Tautonia sociabilis]|uniref:VWA domain-containing protein n=1 Tax=Tautonia sociabilis TaxID=2080755 RepID=A0A432MIW7_9BACT|nr:BatA domain-containing protein [Tautonia sociabilis]RUL87177.1 VWA domain-containing protein [Tautonia sociabilis]
MSFLTPLYLLGALAVAAPIVVHLIRRSPKGEVLFSSLMFLSPTPPKITRRSRLENWPLLLLRALALILLALAFGRPFLRKEARLEASEAGERRIVVLLDTSASMRRGDLWERAKGLADAAIADARPGDRLALLAFDEETTPVMSLDESDTLDPRRRLAVARARLADLSPSWRSTDLGQALLDAVAAVQDTSDDEEEPPVPRLIILVSDLQRGASLDALGDFEWPSDVVVELKSVADPSGNASLQRLAEPPEPGPGAKGGSGADVLRVRVSNEASSAVERFRLRWAGGGGAPIDVSVPPGESRVVRVEPPEGGSGGALVLEGDAHPFDNTLSIADPPRVEETVLYVGDDATDDPRGLRYYVDRVFDDLPRRSVRVRGVGPGETLAIEAEASVPLIILEGEPDAERVDRLARFARDGGTILAVLTGEGRPRAVEAIVGTDLGEVADAVADPDVMLGQIDFGHPLFSPLSAPQYNDFTSVRFWNYRRLDEEVLGDARVVSRFEGGDPAVVEWPVGRGRVVLFAAGWAPGDGQLARSSKFVPLMAALLDLGGDDRFDATSLIVGDPVPLPEGEGDRAVRTPAGAVVALADQADWFEGTDAPGLYAIESSGGSAPFAVNLDPSESRTDPIELAALEQLGVRSAGREADPAAEAEQLRQLMNAELEGRQKLWRWGIVAAIGILIVETWLAGRLARRRPARAEAMAT